MTPGELPETGAAGWPSTDGPVGAVRALAARANWWRLVAGTVAGLAVAAAVLDVPWRAGRTASGPHPAPPGAVAPPDTRTLGDPTSRPAVPRDPAPRGPRAPAPQRLRSTDEFGVVAGLRRLADGTLRVSVDRVDWLSGADAQAAAAADGTDAGDYYVVNDSPALRTYDVAPGAVVYGSIMLTGVPELSRRTIRDWTGFLSHGSPAHGGQHTAEQVRGTYFHFQVEGGLVVGVEEKYRP